MSNGGQAGRFKRKKRELLYKDNICVEELGDRPAETVENCGTLWKRLWNFAFLQS